jgi:hypothetical protein
VSDANVVGVNDQEFCIAGKAEAFGESLASVLGVRIKERARKKKDKEQSEDAALIPKKRIVHGEDSLSLDGPESTCGGVRLQIQSSLARECV